jgi:hypothetical protein
VVSLTTVIMSRRQQKMNAFLQIQSLLMTQELQQGRRLAYAVHPDAPAPVSGSLELRQIDQAMATLDLLGTFTRRGIVPRNWVLDFWHRSLRDLRPAYETVVRVHRERWLTTVTLWPDLDFLLKRAEGFRCQQPCCIPSANCQEPLDISAKDGQRPQSAEAAPPAGPSQ